MAKHNTRGTYPIAKRALSKAILKCPDCGNTYTVYRTIKVTRSYQPGHIKDLWCHICKGERKHIQLSSNDAKYNY